MQTPTTSVQFTDEEMAYIQQKKKIVMCTDPNWMPYEKFDENGKYIGVSADYHAMISHLTGLSYEIIQTDSWPATLEKAQRGECDILSILNKTPERAEYLDFSEPYITSPSVFVTRERDKFINGIGDLQGKTLAVVKGYMIDEIIKSEHPDIDRVYAPNLIEALRMVSKGKAFATAGSLLEMSYNIRQLGMLNLKITGDAKYGYELRIGVRKGEKMLLSVIDKALSSITKEDRDKILNKWISIKYQKSYDYSFIWKLLFVFVFVLTLVIMKVVVTSKYNQQLLKLNEELQTAKDELEEINKTLERKVAEETAGRLKNERLLMQQSKLAAMGDMIGAIAHQWRQPLNAVAMLVQDIEDQYQTDSMTEESLKESVAQSMAMVLQMSETINDFSNFFRPDKNKETFKLCKSITDVAGMFFSQLTNHNISFNIACQSKNLNDIIGKDEYPFDCCTTISVNGYPNEFKHVIVNMIKNAMDALDDSDIENKFISIDIATDRKHDITICISDNGGGIPKDVSQRIFEPYFSTKQQGKGVGIGLYMSKQIVENMKGQIWFENKDGGTAFYIKLPIHTEDK